MAKQPRVWTGTQWDTLAVTLPDLSNYSTTTQMNTAIDNAKGLVYITGSTFSAASTVNIDNVFSTTYANYVMHFNITAASTDLNLSGYFRSSGANNTTANYGTTNTLTDYSNGPTRSVGWGGTSITLGSVNTAASSTYSAHFIIHTPNVATRTYMHGNILQPAATPAFLKTVISNTIFNADTQFDGIQVATSTGNITGNIRIYGLRNS